MRTIGVIPARWASTRLDGKVLIDIAGKPMIQHVWERAQKSKYLDDLLIACDDEKVKNVSEGFGARAIMTSHEHACGTDRIAEAVENHDAEIIVNIQADEPLIDPIIIDSLVSALKIDQACSLATVIKVLEDKDDLEDPNTVKVVIDQDKNALYFSRSIIPYKRDQNLDVTYYKHYGIYAFRREFLFTFKDLPRTHLENAERLEQLRALENGYNIKTVLTDIDTIGVDTPEDLKRVQNFLK